MGPTSSSAASDNRTANYSSAESTGTKLVFTYAVSNTDFDHDGLSIPAGSINLPSGASIAATANNAIASNNASLAVGPDANFRVDAMSLDSANGTSKGLLIRGVNSGGSWYFMWDKNSNGIIDSGGVNDSSVFSSDTPTALTVAKVLSGSPTGESNPNIDISLTSVTTYQNIKTSGFPTTWQTFVNTYWASDSDLTNSSQEGYNLTPEGFGQDVVSATRLTAFKVDPVL